MVSFDKCITIEVNDSEKRENIFKWFKEFDDKNDIKNN